MTSDLNLIWNWKTAWKNSHILYVFHSTLKTPKSIGILGFQKSSFIKHLIVHFNMLAAAWSGGIKTSTNPIFIPDQRGIWKVKKCENENHCENVCWMTQRGHRDLWHGSACLFITIKIEYLGVTQLLLDRGWNQLFGENSSEECKSPSFCFSGLLELFLSHKTYAWQLRWYI